jgi:hypothetical protein
MRGQHREIGAKRAAAWFLDGSRAADRAERTAADQPSRIVNSTSSLNGIVI